MSLRLRAAATAVLASTVLLAACDGAAPPTAGTTAVSEKLMPGTNPGRVAGNARLLTELSSHTGLQPIVSVTGPVTLSVDGCGSTTPTCTIDIDKPASATVRSAYIATASTGFTNHRVPNGAISINGNAVSWDISIENGIDSWNHWADVTNIIKPLIDAAAPGITSVTVTEASPFNVDGSIIAVVFNVPALSSNRTVALFFGAQQTTGDEFVASLSDPLDKTREDLLLQMSLGISYGFQPSGQFSLIDINGQRLTSCAGGQDDGAAANGALITVGGIGDSPTNPAPNCTDAAGPRSDDELYNLVPLLNQGDQLINIFTRNPSNDDNIFFAAFEFNVRGAVTQEPNEPPFVVDLRTEGTGPFSIGGKSCYGAFTICLRFTVTDPDAGDAPFQVVMDWGDGIVIGPYTIPDRNIPLIAPHNYAAPGNYTVVVTATDARGASVTESIAVTIVP